MHSQVPFTKIAPSRIAQDESNRQWEAFYSNLKKGMKGSDKERDSILRKRVFKFFQDQELESDLFYTKRREVDVSAVDLREIRESSLLIYGIDFLSSERIHSYFHPFQVTLKIYDDSHCSVRFQNAQQLMQAFYTKVMDKFENFNQFYLIFQNNHAEMLQWREIVGYTEMLFERKLWARFLSKADLDLIQQIKGRTMITKLNIAKEKFLSRMEKNQNMNNKLYRYKYGRYPLRDQSPAYQDTIFSTKYQTKTNCKGPKCCCQQRMNKLAEMISCSYHHRPLHSRSTSMRGERFGSERERTRDKRRNKKNELCSFTELANPLPIIENLTKAISPEFVLKCELEQGLKKDISTTGEVAILHSRDDSRDSHNTEILPQFSRNCPFDSDISDISGGEEGSYSFFECDNGDEKRFID